ncbi:MULTISPECIES: FecCD family ABC transporter permease [unclassified Luteococcus]|uniref:FecCD family ABC transporter permease n=1 Tax=unclassified Luteococcus TaxID=2639923 RepID=UPI00313EF2CA
MACSTGLAVMLMALLVLDLCHGQGWIAPRDVLAVVLGTPEVDPTASYLVGTVRGPGALGAVIAGAALGLAGAITQSLLRNPLASPDIIGVNAGASCCVVATLVGNGGGGIAAASGLRTGVVGLLGGLVAGGLVVALAWRAGLTARRVVLVGLGVGAGLQGLTSWLLLQVPAADLSSAMVWLTGSLANVPYASLGQLGAGVGACLLLAAANRGELSLLQLGDLTVRSLGVRLWLAQGVQALLAVVAAALACAVAGPVPFIAFSAPQLAQRALRSPGPPPLVSAMTGAALLVGADIAARTALGTPVPVGLVTAVLGGPVLLWTLMNRSRPA